MPSMISYFEFLLKRKFSDLIRGSFVSGSTQGIIVNSFIAKQIGLILIYNIFKINRKYLGHGFYFKYQIIFNDKR